MSQNLIVLAMAARTEIGPADTTDVSESVSESSSSSEKVPELKLPDKERRKSEALVERCIRLRTRTIQALMTNKE